MGGINANLVPIIVLTGDQSENEKNKCLNILKVKAFMTKPISFLEFTQKLRKLFREGQEVGGDKKILLVINSDKYMNNLTKLFLTGHYKVIQAYSVTDVNKYLTTYMFVYISYI